MNKESKAFRSCPLLGCGLGWATSIASTGIAIERAEASRSHLLLSTFIHGFGNLSIGDQRKLDSYLVEANFYEHHAQQLLQSGVPLPPLPHFVELQLADKVKPTIIIAMGELMTYSNTNNDRVDETHESVMKWLAKFHAATWHSDATGIQAVGSYWHLDTRPSEWQSIRQFGLEGRLKLAAKAIDLRLKRDPLQCWVHGDAKDANILYDDSGQLAFCDFQYCGRGPPTRDLAYYFCSSHVADDVEREELTQLYFESLIEGLSARDITAATLTPTRRQLDDSLELAFADWCRFMAGWGYWGYDVSHQVKATLDKLDGGRALNSEQEYIECVERLFG